ncbi:MAG: hypothetical protein AAFQ34_05965 [Pseudomonadota bacterium]
MNKATPADQNPDEARSRSLEYAERVAKHIGIGIVIVSIVSIIVLTMPSVRTALQANFDLPPAAMPIPWLKWCSFALGILTALVFGSYLFAGFTKDPVKKYCETAEFKQAAKAEKITTGVEKDAETLKDLATNARNGEPFSKADMQTLLRIARENLHLNPFARSPYEDVALHLIFQGIPGKVYGLVAYIFFIAKISIDVAVMYAGS